MPKPNHRALEVDDLRLAKELQEKENRVQQWIETAVLGWSYDEIENSINEGPADEEEKPDTVNCTCCNDDIVLGDALTMACSHPYCRDCLSNLYTACTTDVSLFPPTCCKRDFDHDLVLPFLSQEAKTVFEAKQLELETKNRIYCAIEKCSAFIHPKHIKGQIAECQSCERLTCVFCRARFHVGKCDDAFMEVAKAAGWKRCECGRVIELYFGCNHIR